MARFLSNLLSIHVADRKWYQIILWWEFRRIVYNLLMIVIGMLSLSISFVTMPVIYILIGFALNILYTLLWLIELSIRPMLSEKQKMDYPKKAFMTYLLLSALFVFGLAFQLSFCWDIVSFFIALIA